MNLILLSVASCLTVMTIMMVIGRRKRNALREQRKEITRKRIALKERHLDLLKVRLSQVVAASNRLKNELKTTSEQLKLAENAGDIPAVKNWQIRGLSALEQVEAYLAEGEVIIEEIDEEMVKLEELQDGE